MYYTWKIMEDCLFCQIVRGEKPAYKIYEDDSYLAFLDIFPFLPCDSMVVAVNNM